MKKYSVGILGSGTMGKQLALLVAAHGFDVKLWNHKDQTNLLLDLKRNLKLYSKQGYIEKEQIDSIILRIDFSIDINIVKDCGLIIEAVKEDVSVKSAIIKQVVEHCLECAVIATNTSTLSITELAALAKSEDKFLGVHFFNPPMSMKLVEIIRGEYTSQDTLDLAVEFVEQLGKNSVILPETPGFVVNRLLFPMINEAVFLLSEGVSDSKTIDSCMRLGVNHPMGPLELADLIGLDVCLSILETLVDETGDGKYRPAPLLRKFVRAGKLGRKVGIGFYSYKRS